VGKQSTQLNNYYDLTSLLLFISLNVQYEDFASRKLNGPLALGQVKSLTLPALHPQMYLLSKSTGEDKNVPLQQQELL